MIILRKTIPPNQWIHSKYFHILFYPSIYQYNYIKYKAIKSCNCLKKKKKKWKLAILTVEETAETASCES